MLNPTWPGPSAKISPTTDNSPQPQNPTGVHPNSGARVTQLSNESPQLRELASHNPAKKVDYLKYAKFARSLMENQTSNAATTGLQATLTPVAPAPRPKEPSPETIKAGSSPASPSPRANSGDKTLPETKQAKASEPTHEPQDAKSGTLKPASPQTDSKASNVEAGQGQTSTLAKTAPPKTTAETMTSSIKPAPMPKPRGKAGPIPKSPSPSPSPSPKVASAPHERRANNSSKPGTENATSSASTAPARLESEAKLGDIQSYLKDFPDRQPRSRILLLTWFNDYAKELVAEKKPENFYSPAARDFFSKQNFFPALPTSAAGALIMSHVWLHPQLRTADAASFANEIDTTISNFLKIFADGYHRIGVSMSDMHVRVEPSKMQSFMDEVMVAHQSSLETPIDQLVKKCAIDWGVPFG